MPTPNTDRNIVGYFILSIFIAIFILAFFTRVSVYEFSSIGLSGTELDMPGSANTPTAANAITTGMATFTLISGCSVELREGWNFVSFCADETNKTIQSILNSTSENIRFVLEWNNTAQNFMVYSPRASTPPFNAFNFNKSYFIYYSDTDGTNISLNGPIYGDVNITLNQGWETPNYPYSFTANITKYLNTIAGQYKFVQKWNYTPQEFMIYSTLSSNNPFYTIDMGQGQFILITDPSGTTIQYNKTDLENG